MAFLALALQRTRNRSSCRDGISQICKGHDNECFWPRSSHSAQPRKNSRRSLIDLSAIHQVTSLETKQPGSMGRSNNSSAYRDMDEEFFASLEEANYECHESPIKKTASCSTTSESSILHKHLEHRRAVRNKVIVTLSLLLLAGVGATALYSSVDASTWAMKMRGPCQMLRGSSSVAAPTAPSSAVFEEDEAPDFGAAILAAAQTVTTAQDNLMLDELDPYDQFRAAGEQQEAH
jgi:hypothetical protein